MLLGLFSFASFFLVLALLLDRSAVAIAFGVSSVVALTTQAGTLWALRRRRNATTANHPQHVTLASALLLGIVVVCALLFYYYV